MKNKILLVVIIFLVPITIISFFLNKKNDIKPKQTDIVVKLKIKETNEIKKLNLEEYVIGVVAAEMPASFDVEALKAQAVASRTFVLNFIKDTNEYDVDDTTSYQSYINQEKMKEKWSENYYKYYQKIAEAVYKTEGEIITYNNKLIKSYYFSTSNGYTEDAITVFKTDEPYLVSVTSPEKNEERKDLVLTKKQFCEKLNLKECEEIEISNQRFTESKRIESLTINNQIFTGIELRKLLNLRSTDFEIKLENNVVISTLGYGHGVGMSQYGANKMAQNNQTYKQIIKHYYQNTEIEKITSIK